MSGVADIPVTIGDALGYTHVRVVIGLVTGLSITRLLTGLARFVQHPSRNAIYPPHLAWVLYLLLFVIHFWWFEFSLFSVTRWQFTEYIFVICYAATIFFTASLLFPDRMEEYSGFAQYFHSRQRWFYGLLAALFLLDIIDSAMKGRAHFTSLGTFYPIRQALLCVFALAGMMISNRRFHLIFPIAAIGVEVWWIAAQFRFLD